MVLADRQSRILQGMYSGFLRFPSPKEIWCSESGSGINSEDWAVSYEKKLNSDSGCMQGIITLGACPNFFLVFVSDRSRSGLAKNLVQSPDSIAVLR